MLSWAAGKYPLPPGDTLVGRSRGCQLVLEDPSISRSHALVIVSGETISLKDLGSSNGTFVNGQQLEGEVEVHPGDRLCLGETDLELRRLSDEQVQTGDFVATLGRELALELGDDREAPPETVRPARSGELPRRLEEEDPMVAAARVMAPEQEARFAPAPSVAEVEPAASSSGDLLRGGLDELDAVIPFEALTSGGDDPAPPPAPASLSNPADPGDGELLPSLSGLDDIGPVLPPVSPEPASPSGVHSAAALRDSLRKPRREFPPPAGFWVRLAASAVDGLLISVLAFAASLSMGGPWRASGGGIFTAVFFALALLVPMFGWTIWGTTPGKRLFGLYVCGVDGSLPLGGGRALLRLVAYFASMLSLGVGFLMIGFTASKRGLHDLLAGTYVGHRS